MEAIVNTLILSTLGYSFIRFFWLLGSTLGELYVSYTKDCKAQEYLDFEYERQRNVWKNTFNNLYNEPKELLVEEPEQEKIRIPMIKFEDIPFAIIEHSKEKETKHVTALDAYNELIRDKDLKLATDTYKIDISNLFICQEHTMKGLERRNPTIKGTLIFPEIQIEDNRQKQKHNYTWELSNDEENKEFNKKTLEDIHKSENVIQTSVLEDLELRMSKHDEAYRKWEIEQKKSRYSYTQGGICRKIPDPRINIPVTAADFEKLEILKLCPSLSHYEKVMTHYGYGTGNEFSCSKLVSIKNELEYQHRMRSLNRELDSYNNR